MHREHPTGAGPSCNAAGKAHSSPRGAPFRTGIPPPVHQWRGDPVPPQAGAYVGHGS